jgi:ApaG protein
MRVDFALTRDISVAVRVIYRELESTPFADQYIWAYEVTIENRSSDTVQLLSRKWEIREWNGHTRIVIGDGVVGKQPVLHPGSSYQYVSGCKLASAYGIMGGFYIFENKEQASCFEVKIPDFRLEVPFLLN